MPYSGLASFMRCEALQLLARVLFDLRRHAGGGDLLLELRHRAVTLVALAQLLLQLVQLLAQHRLALALAERGLGLLGDVLGDLQHLDAMGEQLR